ncbi:DEAD/DEAH box helicase [Streptomyces sp. CA-253872]|uniref:DEAD/DEAH box helicase n=1 Tax=Streptomyces sp. CA-253872 TaxID=3240067 RepID=UPI003D8D4F8F
MSKHHRSQSEENSPRRGMPRRPDDDRLAARTEEERVRAGLDAYDPGEVPPATDTNPPRRVTESRQYQDEKTELDREVRKGEIRPDGLESRRERTEDDPYPPTRYED